MSDKLGLIQFKGYMGSSEAALFAFSHLDELYARFRRDYVDEGLRLLREDAKRPGHTEQPENAEWSEHTEQLGHIEQANGQEVPDDSVSVLEALANLAKEEKIGYEIRLRDVPVRQFTIELCELFGLNPYELKGNIEIIKASEETPMPGFKTIGIATGKLERIYLRD